VYLVSQVVSSLPGCDDDDDDVVLVSDDGDVEPGRQVR